MFQKVFEMSPHLYVGLPGLATDIQTVHQRLKFRQNLYELKEGRRMSPKAFCAMLSNLLYERRYCKCFKSYNTLWATCYINQEVFFW